jgi:alpha,alpha-trehalase
MQTFLELARQSLGVSFGESDVQAIRAYIKQSWRTLRRSNAHLLASAIDVKAEPTARLRLYVGAGEDPSQVRERLRAQLAPGELARVDVLRLPADPLSVDEPGLLYLPKPYVVPGGRFNEMYGWDSYFTVLGLVRDDELALARDMTDNFIYEIEHYGKVLNANRSYYLTRSQPPFVTQMLLEVFARTQDRAWLASAIGPLGKYYTYWTSGTHLTPTGLSRYHGNVAAPAPEVLHHEIDRQGLNHYEHVKRYFRTQPVSEYDVTRYYDAARDELTAEFYYADRAMRESGFDLSARFGPFSAAITQYNSIDINCLLYQWEADMAAMLRLLGREGDAQGWTERALWRAETINRLMWDERQGLYRAYNFEQQRQSPNLFITTFYPLWAGIASAEQAAPVAANLPVFERAWGLQVSDRVTGHQWDAPFGWAPMQVIADAGLRRYGFRAEADRIAVKFLALVLRDFLKYGTIKEKYDVVRGESDLANELEVGYLSNEVGFGWTNAAFLVLLENVEK